MNFDRECEKDVTLRVNIVFEEWYMTYGASVSPVTGFWTVVQCTCWDVVIAGIVRAFFITGAALHLT